MNKIDIREKIKRAINEKDLIEFVKNVSLLVYKKPYPEFALNWLKELESDDNKHLVVLAARNHLKTMTFSVYYALWRMIQTPMYEVVLFSYSVEQAKYFLDILKEIVEFYFPEWLNRKSWSKMRISLVNGSSYIVGSLTSTRYGFHPDLIIVDDPLGGEGDPQKIVKSNLPPGFIEERFFSMIIPMLSPDSKLIVTGIPFYYGDLFTKLKEKSDAYKILEYPAILDEEKKIVLWPEERGYDWLIKQKASIGYARFGREYMLRPYDENSSLIPSTVLIGCYDYDLVLSRKRMWDDSLVVVSSDFAISSTLGADYSVFFATEHKNGKIYILDIERFKESDYRQQIEMFFDFIDRYNPDKIIVEKNNFQKIYSQNVNAKYLNVEEYMTHSEKNLFNIGIPSLRILFENKKIVIPYGDEETREKMDIFTTELQGFVYVDNKVIHIGRHDDTAMAFYLGIQGLRSMISLESEDRDKDEVVGYLKEDKRIWESI